jgi:hypothetical protein
MAMPNAKTPTTWDGPDRAPVALKLACACAISVAILAGVGAGFSTPTSYALARAQDVPAALATLRKPIEVAIIPAVVDVVGVREERAASERSARVPG